MSGALLGIDVGTTATKVTLAAPDGAVLAEATAACTQYSPHPGWAEAEPDEWWTNVTTLVPEALAKAGVRADAVAAIGVSGMVPTLICAAEDGTPLRRSIQQNDSRATAEIDQLREELAGVDVLGRTGSQITAQSIGPKVRWLARHEPEVLTATAWIAGSYDWMVFRLTGRQGVEANWALESGLYDLAHHDWDTRLLEAAGTKTGWLGPVGRCDEVIGTVTAEAAAATGLSVGTPVTAGSADHVASAFSAGLRNEGDLLVKLGGAGDILLTLDEPVVDERLFLDYHLVPGRWLLNGCMAASGSVLRWFQRELAGGAAFPELDSAAAEVPAGSDGLLCLPYFLGEKSPINDPRARGAFVGLHLGHTRAHLYRAALEAIAYGFAHHVEVFAERDLAVRRVRVTNGGSRSRLWRQIVADVLGLPLESLVAHPGSSLGAAFAAGVAVRSVGWDDIDRFARPDETVTPDPARHHGYREVYEAYRELYPALAPISHRLAERQSLGGAA